MQEQFKKLIKKKQNALKSPMDGFLKGIENDVIGNCIDRVRGDIVIQEQEEAMQDKIFENLNNQKKIAEKTPIEVKDALQKHKSIRRPSALLPNQS